MHGYTRTTIDVDVVLAMSAENLACFISGAGLAGLHPRIPVDIESLARPDLIEQLHRGNGMLAVSLRTAETQATVLDVLIRPVIAYADLRQDAVVLAIGPYAIPVASVDHLIAMKSGTGRNKDVIDIEELQRIRQPRPS